jgi:DNA-binding protein HU-beta
MTKRELARRVAEQTGQPQAEAAHAVDAVLAAIAAALARGEEVAVSGFGTFRVRQRAARQARDLRTGAPRAVPAHAAVVFQPGAGLRRAVAGGSDRTAG